MRYLPVRERVGRRECCSTGTMRDFLRREEEKSGVRMKLLSNERDLFYDFQCPEKME